MGVPYGSLGVVWWRGVASVNAVGCSLTGSFAHRRHDVA